MNIKRYIIEFLKIRLEKELLLAQEVSDSTRAYVGSSDMKQEGKYDTRATEAGYLAGAQLKRVEEIKQELELLEKIPIQNNSDNSTVILGSIVTLKLNQRSQQYFLSTIAGGSMVEIAGQSYLVISVFSPLGSEVLGLSVGDQFSVETPQGERIYTIEALE